MSSADSDQERADGRASDAAPEESFWAAAGGFSEQVAEEHASKIVALWELGGELEGLKPARGEEGEDEGDWAAERPSAVELAHPAEEEPVAIGGALDERSEEPREGEPSERAPAASSAPRAAEPAPEPAPAIDDPVELPSSGRTKLFAVIGAAAALLLAVVAGMSAFGESEAPELPRAALNAPSAAAPSSGGTGAGAVEAAELENAEPQATEAAEDSEAARAQIEPEDAEPVDEPEERAAPVEPERSAVEESPQLAAVTESPAVEEPAAAAAVQAAPPAPAPPPTATLRVRTEPAGATLTVDGRPASNPYSATVPVGSRVRLSARAEGYRDASRTLRVGSGTEEVTLTLAARPAPRARPARPAPRARPARPAPRARPARAPRPRQARPAATERRARGAGFTTENPY